MAGLPIRFRLLLAGATWRDRLFACLGALAGIGLSGLVAGLVENGADYLPFIVAPMGASAVLVFAVPASPMAQPWPVIGGNVLSALVGITVYYLVPLPVLAAGIAVALAILVMSLTRSLHPPGGAAALLTVLGGPAIAASGYWFALLPIGLNAVLLTAAGWLFHRLSGHSYPHRPPVPQNVHRTTDPPASTRVGFNRADVDRALSDLHETFDIRRADLEALLRRIEDLSLQRAHPSPTVAAIMSRDVVRADAAMDAAEATRLLLDHSLRLLPVVDGAGHLMGAVGLRQLLRPDARVGDVMVRAIVASPDDPAMTLVAPLTDGSAHAAFAVDDGRLVGIVTQTDLLATLARLLPR